MCCSLSFSKLSFTVSYPRVWSPAAKTEHLVFPQSTARLAVLAMYGLSGFSKHSSGSSIFFVIAVQLAAEVPSNVRVMTCHSFEGLAAAQRKCLCVIVTSVLYDALCH